MPTSRNPWPWVGLISFETIKFLSDSLNYQRDEREKLYAAKLYTRLKRRKVKYAIKEEENIPEKALKGDRDI